MLRNAILGCCVLVCLVFNGCEPRPPKVNTVGEAANTLHLVPFSCSFLGIPLSELDACSIACPGSVFAAHELGQFTASLSCTHPKYELLQCGIDR